MAKKTQKNPILAGWKKQQDGKEACDKIEGEERILVGKDIRG